MNWNQISKIKKIKFKKPEKQIKGEEEKCPICIDEFNDEEDLRLLPCKHIFHPQCIDTWLV